MELFFTISNIYAESKNALSDSTEVYLFEIVLGIYVNKRNVFEHIY